MKKIIGVTLSFIIIITILIGAKSVGRTEAFLSHDQVSWLESREAIYYRTEGLVPEYMNQVINSIGLLLDIEFIALDSQGGKSSDLVFTTDKLLDQMSFQSDPLMNNSFSIYGSQDVVGMERIGVLESVYEWIRSDKTYSYIKYDKLEDLIRDQETGQIDGFITGQLAYGIHLGDQVFFEAERLAPIDSVMYAYANDFELINILNAGIGRMKSNSTFDHVLTEYLDGKFKYDFMSFLTKEEKNWLTDKEKLTVGLEENPPYVIRKDDQLYGPVIGLFNEFSQVTGVEVEYVIGNEERLVDNLAKRNIQLLILKRSDFTSDPFTFIDSKYVVVGQEMMWPMVSKSQLGTYRIGMLLSEGKLGLANNVTGKSLFFKDVDSLNQALTDGKIDAFLLPEVAMPYVELTSDADRFIIGETDLEYQLNFQNIQDDQALESILGKIKLFFPVESYISNSTREIAASQKNHLLWIGGILVVLFFAGSLTFGIMYFLNHRDKKQMNYLFSHDQLTHLPNKYGACQHVDEKIRDREAFYMLMINIDRFKEINERFGYQYGDSLLIEYSKLLLSVVEKNMLFARMDGDGFLLVAPSAGEQDCMFMSKHIMNMTKEFENSKEELYEFSVSVSRISHPKYGQNYHELLSFLEHTMKYQRKFLGQGRDMEFTMDIYDGYLREQQLVKEVKAGIDHKEFDVFIQPQVDLANNKTIGGEALVRWNHPQKGLLGPAMFLEIVEKHGLMRMLDYYVFEKVCYLLKEWQDIYEPFKVSVNRNLSS